jgi:hypothetical protein
MTVGGQASASPSSASVCVLHDMSPTRGRRFTRRGDRFGRAGLARLLRAVQRFTKSRVRAGERVEERHVAEHRPDGPTSRGGNADAGWRFSPPAPLREPPARAVQQRCDECATLHDRDISGARIAKLPGLKVAPGSGNPAFQGGEDVKAIDRDRSNVCHCAFAA